MKQETIEVVKVMTEVVKIMLLAGVKVQLRELGTPENKINAFCDAAMPKMVELMQKYYTEEELVELYKLYTSPLGQKGIALMPVLYQESFQIGAEFAYILA